jgi:hypothetical protein
LGFADAIHEGRRHFFGKIDKIPRKNDGRMRPRSSGAAQRDKRRRFSGRFLQGKIGGIGERGARFCRRAAEKSGLKRLGKA